MATPVCRLGEIALITRRSQVQILPPQPNGRPGFLEGFSRSRAFTFWAVYPVADHRLTKTLCHVRGRSRLRRRPLADGQAIDCGLQEAGDEVRVDLGGNVCVAVPKDVLDLPERAPVRQNERRRRVALMPTSA